MTETFTIEVELLFVGNEEQVECVEIDVQCDYSIENNGIGAYEYWGANGVDRGVDCAVIEDTRWNVCDLSVDWCFTKEQNKIIESAIEEKIKDWEDSIMDRVNDARCGDSCFYSEDDSN